jgi:hypothetical protein
MEMPSFNTSCALVIFEQGDNTYLPRAPEITQIVRCGTGRELIRHSWEQTVFYTAQPDNVTFGVCSGEITGGLANRINFDPDLTTTYPLAFFQRADRDPCFDFEYKLFTLYEVWSVTLFPIINGAVQAQGSQQLQIYKPKDSILVKNRVIDRLCCNNPDDFLALADAPGFSGAGFAAVADLAPPAAAEISLLISLPATATWGLAASDSVSGWLRVGARELVFAASERERVFDALGVIPDGDECQIRDMEGTFMLSPVDGGTVGDSGGGPNEGDMRVKKDHRCGKLNPARRGRCRPFINGTSTRLDTNAVAVCLPCTGAICCETFKEQSLIKFFCDDKCSDDKLINEFAIFAWLCAGGR